VALRPSFAIALVVATVAAAAPAAVGMRGGASRSTPTGGFLVVLYHTHT
jgi:biotin transporter BioY